MKLLGQDSIHANYTRVMISECPAGCKTSFPESTSRFRSGCSVMKALVVLFCLTVQTITKGYSFPLLLIPLAGKS